MAILLLLAPSLLLLSFDASRRYPPVCMYVLMRDEEIYQNEF